ncbi:MAG: YraN family protein [Vulcanimicrobiaceae bacterium]
MSERAQLGRAGEARAAAHLSALGFEILRRNLRGPAGEIDIVAREGQTFVFVEVKARRTRRFGRALGAVDARKRARLRAAAADFLQFYAPDAQARFDVLTIDCEGIRLHRNAFW